MAVYKRGRVWWYRFTWNAVPIRESTKQTNKRIAEQMEATHKTSLAKGEVGLRDRKPAPTLREFAETDFLPFVRSTSAAKPRRSSTTSTASKACWDLRSSRIRGWIRSRPRPLVDLLRDGRIAGFKYRVSTESYRRCGGCST